LYDFIIYIQDVTEMCGHILGASSTYQKKKNVHTNMCPVTVERIHDGALAYFSRAVPYVLNNSYLDRWIGRGGPTAGPPRSPDLNPLQFYQWRQLKSRVYAVSLDNEEALHHRIVDACQTIRNHPGIFERMRGSMMRRVEACIESRGGYFEPLL
jgi:hypothetical protein